MKFVVLASAYSFLLLLTTEFQTKSQILLNLIPEQNCDIKRQDMASETETETLLKLYVIMLFSVDTGVFQNYYYDQTSIFNSIWVGLKCNC